MRRTRALAAAALAAAFFTPAAGYAQRTPVYQSGHMIPGNISKFITNGMVGDAGGMLGDALGAGVNPFAVSDRGGSGMAFIDGASNAPHHRLTIGHDAAGNALLTVEAENGATEAGFYCRVNGGTVNCLGGGADVDFSNVAMPAALNHLGLGPAAVEFFPSTWLPLRMESNQPAPEREPGMGFSTLLNILHKTNSTPSALGAMYGAVIRVEQSVPSSIVGVNVNPAYVGAVAVGRINASEGGYASTLAANALAGDTSITVADPTKFVDGARLQIVDDLGLVEGVTVVGSPVGNVVTISDPLIRNVSAGNVVLHWSGTVKGLITQAATEDGAIGTHQHSLEVNMSAKAGSLPYEKAMLFVAGNSDDVVHALSPYDSAIAISGAVGGVGYRQGLSFDPRAGQQAVSSDGTLIKTFGGSYANGIDFSTSHFSGNAISLRGFSVIDEGNLTISSDKPGTGDINMVSLSPQVWWSETDKSPTGGGLWRATLSDTSLRFQYNSSIDNNFSSGAEVLILQHDGAISLPNLPTSGSAVGTVCINSAGALFVKTNSGACL